MEALIDTTTYQSLVASLSATERTRFTDNVARLQELVATADQLSQFLADFGEAVADLYAASTVAIWFRTVAETEPLEDQPKVSIGWKNLGLDAQSEAAHRSLVGYAFQQPDPIAVHPFSTPQSRAAASNPTDSFILFGSVEHEQYNVAVLEIALGPKPLRRPHQELVASYLEWLGWLAQLLHNGIERCFANATQPLLLALETVYQAAQQAETMQNQIRMQIEKSLRDLAGQNFGSLQENQTVVKQIHVLLDSKALRVRCPECGTAAILRCQKAGNSKTGAFMYDHYLDTGRTFHGGQKTFPEITLVPKPARRQKRSVD